MKDMKNICKVVLVQAEPVLFDKEASLKKVLNYIDEAATASSTLAVII